MSEIKVITDWQNANSAAQELGLIITIYDNRFHVRSRAGKLRTFDAIGELSAYLSGLLDSKQFFKK